jgi:8-oxo-dGTP diphosphatase
LVAIRERPILSARTNRLTAISIDLVLCARQGPHLAVLLGKSDTRVPAARAHWELPRALLADGESLDKAAARAATRACGVRPAWLAQAGTFCNAPRRSPRPALSVVYVGVTPDTHTPPPGGGSWFTVDDLPLLAAGQRPIVISALGTLRDRTDYAPIAFRLLPRSFTLGELQETYEMLLGRQLHKASFRRSLKAAHLVTPTGSWRSKGRGRPAQLFRFFPRRLRGNPRGVRFELIGG